MSRGWWAVVKAASGLVVLGVLASRVGTEPFVAGLEAVGPASVVAALVLTALTTVASAQRWRLVGRAYGVRMTLRAGVAAYYRSQFLNSVLPGGVLGDVHRGVTNRAMGSVGGRAGGRARRCRSRWQGSWSWSRGRSRRRPPRSPSRPRRSGECSSWPPSSSSSCARGWLEVEVVPPVLALSALATAGHAAVFVVAARAAGVDARDGTARGPRARCPRGRGHPVQPGGLGPARGGRGLGVRGGRSGCGNGGDRGRHVRRPRLRRDPAGSRPPPARVQAGEADCRREDGGRPCLTGPYILLSCGMSIDGYLDNASSQRLLLSNQDDLERVDAVRAASDAILVGAQTVRLDNPRSGRAQRARPR